MSHLKLAEMIKCMDGVYTCLFGEENYKRLRRLKPTMYLKYPTEQYFMERLLDICVQHVKNINIDPANRVDTLADDESVLHEAHLKFAELTSCTNAIYLCMFGVDNYDRYKWLKARVSCPNEAEREFMTWMLDVAERAVYPVEPVDLQLQAQSRVQTTISTHAVGSTNKDNTIQVVVSHDHPNAKKAKSCRFCPRTFMNFFQRSHHEREAHADECMKVPCEYCDQRFPNATARDQHHRVKHTHISLTPCPHCGKTFGKGTLTNHILRVHRLKCKVCNKSSKNKDGLRHHMKAWHPAVFAAEYATPQNAAEYGTEKTAAEYGTPKTTAEYGTQNTAAEYGIQKTTAEYGAQKTAAEYGTQKTTVEYTTQNTAAEYGTQKTTVEYTTQNTGAADYTTQSTAAVAEYIIQNTAAAEFTIQNTAADYTTQRTDM